MTKQLATEFSSVQFSRSVAQSCLILCDPMNHSMPGFLSITNSTCSNLYPLSQWCHPTISSSVIPFSSSLQSFPASRTFLTRQFLQSGGQSIADSASASVLPMNILDWFSLGWTGWISCCPRNSQESSPTPQFKKINSWHSGFFNVQLTSMHD